ncbi:WD40 repeat domain-containing protein [Streptomyces achromogenes]|uniref:WD40 repeat domain-containing protein n=1 Tax=Streptomyces achromogenes TaxID=67255 RepID=UPI0036FBD82E
MAVQAYQTSATADARAGLLRAADLKLAHLLGARGGDIQTVAFSADGRTLVSAGTGTLRLWDVATGRQRGSAIAADGEVGSVAFSPDGTLLAGATTDATGGRSGSGTWAQAGDKPISPATTD